MTIAKNDTDYTKYNTTFNRRNSKSRSNNNRKSDQHSQSSQITTIDSSPSIVDQISDSTISQLNEQERLLEFTNRNHKLGPVRTILGVVGTMLNKTGPGRLMKRVSEINTKNKIARQAQKERRRLQEEVTDWSR